MNPDEKRYRRLTPEQKVIRALRSLIRGEVLYANFPPMVSEGTIKRIEALGLEIQREHPLHEPPMYYPLIRGFRPRLGEEEKWKARAEAILGELEARCDVQA